MGLVPKMSIFVHHLLAIFATCFVLSHSLKSVPVPAWLQDGSHFPGFPEKVQTQSLVLRSSGYVRATLFLHGQKTVLSPRDASRRRTFGNLSIITPAGSGWSKGLWALDILTDLLVFVCGNNHTFVSSYRCVLRPVLCTRLNRIMQLSALGYPRGDLSLCWYKSGDVYFL